MPCGSCHHNQAVRVEPALIPQTKKDESLIVGLSDNKVRVKLRYYGGGMGYTTSGCHACGSSGKYALKTTETIQFASDDEPTGWFSKQFNAGYDYYVTESQAKYLLGLTYTNPAGQAVHKFKKVE